MHVGGPRTQPVSTNNCLVCSVYSYIAPSNKAIPLPLPATKKKYLLLFFILLANQQLSEIKLKAATPKNKGIMPLSPWVDAAGRFWGPLHSSLRP